MITRVHHHLAGLAVVGGLAISAFGCDKVPLLAPSGSAITLTTPVTALPINGSADIVAQVIEPAGTPPQRGTLVSFTTTLGSIQPGQAETDSSGIVRVKFLAGTASGTALITAISGGVATSSQSPLRILIGTAAVGSVRVSANPTLLPAIGGTSVITAQALDVNGNPLSAAPVTFSTSAGLIDQSFATTDQNGLATTTLRTATNATVTAAVGAQAGSSTPPTTPPASGTTPPATTPSASGVASGSVTVNVSGAPTLLITPPASPPGEGLPATFVIAVTAATTNGSAVRDVTVDWGDGSTQRLGAVSGTATVSHIYKTAAIYQIVVSVTDSFGNVVSQSTSVTVIPVALPTVNITPNVPTTPSNPTTVTLTIEVTTPTGVSIKNATINYGDGITETIGGINGRITKTHPYSHTPNQSFTVTVTVEDTLGRFTAGTATFVIP